MHRISSIEIQNFRACQSVSLPLDDFTPLVGQNNVGKTTILESLKWLLKPDARSSSDFADAEQPIVVTAQIEGISPAILGLIPEPKHRTAIEPFCPKGVLWIRVSADGTTAKSLKLEVWNPAVVEADGKPKEWRPYPTGLPQAVSAILPEPLSIQAMKDVQKDFTSVTAGTSIKKLIEEIAEPVTKALAANDLPENKNGFRAADVWALLAADAEGKTVASEVHNQLKGHSVWDDRSHVLIYEVLGISEDEGMRIDVYQNEGRFLYKYAGSFLEEAAKLCFKKKFPDSGSVRVPNNHGSRPKLFGVDCLAGGDALEIKWRDATTDGDHITKEHTRMQAVRDAGYKPVRVMFYYPNRNQAIRIQKALESLYKSVQGEYHYADAAWAYVKRRTGVDSLGILRDLAAERTAQHGQ